MLRLKTSHHTFLLLLIVHITKHIASRHMAIKEGAAFWTKKNRTNKTIDGSTVSTLNAIRILSDFSGIDLPQS